MFACFEINGQPARQERRESKGIIAHPQPNIVKVNVGLGLGWGCVGLGWDSAIVLHNFEVGD